MTIAQYHAYFKNICERLDVFGGTENDVFRYISQPEAIGDFRATEGSSEWKFRLIEPTYKYEGTYDLHRVPNFAFIIAKQYSERESATENIIALQEEIEDLGQWFLVKMSSDSETMHTYFDTPHTFEDFSFKSATKPYLVDGFIARLFTFTIRSAANPCVQFSKYTLND